MAISIIKEKNAVIAFIVFILVFFIPSSSILGGFQLWYVITISVITYGVFRNKLKYDIVVRNFFIFTLLSSILLSLSFILSSSSYGSLQDFNEVLRVYGVFMVFYLMYLIYTPKLEYRIVFFFKVFLILELLFCFFQGFDSLNRLLGLIWNTDRVWDLRRTGSFSNPNILSVFSVAVYSYIFFRIKVLLKILFGLIVLGIILLTSSKTGLISFLFILNVNIFLIRAKFNIKTILSFVIILLGIGYLFVTLLYKYQLEYPYLAQIVNMFENNMNVSEIKSIGDRQSMWENALNKFNDFSALQKFFGIGPAKDTELNVIDNEFLTILVKMGIIGCLFYFVYIMKTLYFLMLNKELLGAKTMVSVVILFLLVSGSASTFISWHLSLLFFLFLGICLKEIKIFKE